MRPYFNCHNHTAKGSNLRLIDSINTPENLVNMAMQLGLSGIGFTEHECLSTHVEINKIMTDLQKQGSDFVIALGNEIYLTDTRDSGQKYYHFLLLAKDEIGHKALRELSSNAWYHMYSDRGQDRVPTLKSELEEIVNKYKGHLIATTACIGGELSSNALLYKSALNVNDQNNAGIYYKKICDFVEYCLKLFGEDFYIECAPSNKEDQVIVNKALYGIAKYYGVKMTVGTDSHYLTNEDREVHKAYLNSKEEEREVDDFYEFARLMDSDEVEKLLAPCFPEGFVNEIFDNTLEIQNKIKYYSLFHKQDIPRVEVKDYPKYIEEETSTVGRHEHLRNMLNDDDVQNRYWVNECLNKLYQLANEKEDIGLNIDSYLDELEEEARVKSVISEKLETNMFRYPNTLQHYIDLIWDCGSIVGAGRGSSCAALNHYLMGITQLDPIEWKLPFFRYLNDERVELGSLILILPSCK